MSNENNSGEISQKDTANTDKNQSLPFHNPLKPDDGKEITQENLEMEQKYKEALSERD